MKSLIIILCVFLVFLIFFNFKYTNKNITCIDGDTFKIDNVFYRLSYIDTPEKNEKGYKESSQYTCNKIKNNKIKIKEHGKDKYNRTLAEVIINGSSLNEELINNCLAIPFYSKTTNKILKLYDKTKCNN